MNAFPILAALTLAISFAVLRASFQELSEAPIVFDRRAELSFMRAEHIPMLRPKPAAPPDHGFGEATEGLLDRELVSEDPVSLWLERYLTPPAPPAPQKETAE